MDIIDKNTFVDNTPVRRVARQHWFCREQVPQEQKRRELRNTVELLDLKILEGLAGKHVTEFGAHEELPSDDNAQEFAPEPIDMDTTI